MRITRARDHEAETLSEIALAAKSYWGYPAAWLDSWRGVLTLTPAYMAVHEIYVARLAEGEIAGFVGLTVEDQELRLEHLWVRPACMGCGVGRALFRHAQARGAALGFAHLEFDADPHAAAFYERMGARQVGSLAAALPDRSARELPVFRCSTGRTGEQEGK